MSNLPFSYREYKSQVGAVKARQALLKTYQECHSIKQTARTWSCHRQTVRAALAKKLNQDLKDGDTTPLHQPRKTPAELEARIKSIRLDTGYGKIRVRRELKTQHNIVMKESTVGKIINRLNLPKKSYRNAWRRKTRQKYDSKSLAPFERSEVDTKEILDKKGLSKQVYEYFTKSKHVPKYQWTWLDVASRLRFLAYSYECSWLNGQIFNQLVRAWLCLHGIVKELNMSIDGGREWQATTEKSFDQAVEQFYQPLGLQPSLIRKGHPEDNPYVERSHRTDDEELYVPYGLKFTSQKMFSKIAWWWTMFYNTRRHHQGLQGKTPLQELKGRMPYINSSIANFPPVILDRHFYPQEGVQNVFDYYLDK